MAAKIPRRSIDWCKGCSKAKKRSFASKVTALILSGTATVRDRKIIIDIKKLFSKNRQSKLDQLMRGLITSEKISQILKGKSTQHGLNIPLYDLWARWAAAIAMRDRTANARLRPSIRSRNSPAKRYQRHWNYFVNMKRESWKKIFENNWLYHLAP